MRAVVIGQVEAGEQAALVAAAARAQAQLRVVSEADARALLIQDDPPNCVLLSPSVDAAPLIDWLRDHPQLAGSCCRRVHGRPSLVPGGSDDPPRSRPPR